MTWNHQVCDECYQVQRDRLNLPRKEPIRLNAGPTRLFDSCCLCRRWNNSGIYVRIDPAVMPCDHWSDVLG